MRLALLRTGGRDTILAELDDEGFTLASLAPTVERADEVIRTTKQYLLHHGHEGRLSTAGNLAFPFTPPEVSTAVA